QKQVLQVPNTWAGMAFSPDGRSLYVSGGVDDSIHTFGPSPKGDGEWAETGPKPISLAHAAGVGPGIKAVAAGIAVTADGQRLAVANMYNDSISLIDVAARRVTAEIDLRPGKSGGESGAPGGNY